MNGRVVHFESPEHREIDALLPWHVNGSLSSDERGRVEAHLAECARCQREAEWLRELQASTDEPMAETDAEIDQAWQRLHAGIEVRKGRRVLAGLRSVRRGWTRAPAWTRWALAAQVALCAGLALALAQTRASAPYHTLGAADAPSRADARIAVIFDPETSEDRIRALLQGCDARIVDGPTVTGTYVLSVPRARSDRALSLLRSARGVRTAASLAAPDGH